MKRTRVLAISFFLIGTIATAVGIFAVEPALEYTIAQPISVRDSRFVKTVGDLLDPAFVGGNQIRALANGDEIFPAMLKAIREARQTITFESYIYWSGKTGEEFAKALSERARAGVKVHLLLDWAGSGKIDDAYITQMKDAGVEVERFHGLEWGNLFRLNNRTHRKILVVDGRLGFTGGVGIADEWTGDGLDPKRWRDTHFVVEGPVVNQMQSAFMDNWLKLRPQVHLDEAYFPEIKPVGGMQSQMFISSPEEGGSSVRIMYQLAIAGATNRIYLESAYFVPDQHIVETLVAARRRGVDIQILVPGPYGDSAFVHHASRELWGDLLSAGVRIFEYQKAMFHCKVFIVDDWFVSVGSTNFDERSFRINYEANLNVADKEFAQQQLKLFEIDRERSREISLEEWQKRPWSEKAVSRVTSLFSSQL